MSNNLVHNAPESSAPGVCSVRGSNDILEGNAGGEGYSWGRSVPESSDLVGYNVPVSSGTPQGSDAVVDRPQEKKKKTHPLTVWQ